MKKFVNDPAADASRDCRPSGVIFGGPSARAGS